MKRSEKGTAERAKIKGIRAAGGTYKKDLLGEADSYGVLQSRKYDGKNETSPEGLIS